MHILQLNTSSTPFVNGQGSISTRLAHDLVRGLQARHPQATLQVRDLGAHAPALLDAGSLQALYTPAEQRDAQQNARAEQDQALIAELLAADVVVVGAPMYNFGVPAQLKAWIDAVTKAGVSFQYSAQGPVGLLKGKVAYVAISSGGRHRGTPLDHVGPYLQQLFGFLGFAQVHLVYAEGVALGEAALAQALQDAQSQIQAVLPLAA